MSSRPRKISAPMPAESSPGTSTTPSIGPPSPAASSSRNAPSSGDPNSALTAAKLPAVAITMLACGGRVARREADRDARRARCRSRSAAPPGRAPRRTRAWRARRGRPPAARSGAAGRPCGTRRRASGRRCPAGGGSPAPRAAPRARAAAAATRPARESNPRASGRSSNSSVLQLRDQLEEPVRDGGDRDADHRRQHEQLHIGAGAQQRERIGSGRARRIRRGHPSDPGR